MLNHPPTVQDYCSVAPYLFTEKVWREVTRRCKLIVTAVRLSQPFIVLGI